MNEGFDWEIPIASRRPFLLFYGTYTYALFWSLLVTTPKTLLSNSPLVGTVLAVGGMTGLAGLVQISNRSQRTFLVPPGYYLPALTFVIYIGAYIYILDSIFATSLLMIAFAQSGVLITVLSVLSRPVLPPDRPLNPNDRRLYLKHHLTSWYRSAQIVGSYLVVITAGLGVTVFLFSVRSGTALSDPYGRLSIVLVVANIGIVCLLIYIVIKFYVVGKDMRNRKFTKRAS